MKPSVWSMMLLLAAATCVAAFQEACFWYTRDDHPYDDSAPIAPIRDEDQFFQKQVGNAPHDDAASDSKPVVSAETPKMDPSVSGGDGGDTSGKHGTKASAASKPGTKTSPASKPNSEMSPANKPGSKVPPVDAASDPEPVVPAGTPK
ncbi:hypothetical protein IMZ48_22720, partial [Candidatus Bathyarchaeota archaeon]|nr:hypothetical protein [Candidatus Bathyarchaeota archaeon]